MPYLYTNASYAKSDSVIKNGLRYHAATTIKRDAMDLIRHTRFWRVIGAHLIVSVRNLLKVGREEEEKGEEVCGERRGRGRKRRGKGGRDERKRESKMKEDCARERWKSLAGLYLKTKSACSLEGGKKKWWLGGMSERIRTAGSLVELIFKIVCLFRDYNR